MESPPRGGTAAARQQPAPPHLPCEGATSGAGPQPQSCLQMTPPATRPQVPDPQKLRQARTLTLGHVVIRQQRTTTRTQRHPERAPVARSRWQWCVTSTEDGQLGHESATATTALKAHLPRGSQKPRRHSGGGPESGPAVSGTQAKQNGLPTHQQCGGAPFSPRARQQLSLPVSLRAATVTGVR